MHSGRIKSRSRETAAARSCGACPADSIAPHPNPRAVKRRHGFCELCRGRWRRYTALVFRSGSGSVGRAPRLPTAAAIAAQRRTTGARCLARMVLSKSDLCAIHLAAECEFSVAFVNHQSRLLLSIEGNKNIFSDTHYNTKLLTPQPQAHEMKAITVSKAVQPPWRGEGGKTHRRLVYSYLGQSISNSIRGRLNQSTRKSPMLLNPLSANAAAKPATKRFAAGRNSQQNLRPSRRNSLVPALHWRVTAVT